MKHGTRFSVFLYFVIKNKQCLYHLGILCFYTLVLTYFKLKENTDDSDSLAVTTVNTLGGEDGFDYRRTDLIYDFF